MKNLFVFILLLSIQLGVFSETDLDEDNSLQNAAEENLKSDPDDFTLVKGETKRIIFTFRQVWHSKI